MELDTSMYRNLLLPEWGKSFGDGLQRGQQMQRQRVEDQRLKYEHQRLAKERDQKAQVQQAYAAGIVQNPDGTTTFDPNPVQSRLRELAGMSNPFAGEAIYGMANTQYTRDQAAKQQEIDNELRRQQLASAAADRKEARDERRFQSGLVRQERADLRTDSDVQKLSKEVSGVQDATNALDEVERQLGFPIDSAIVQDGKILVKDKAVDLPGVSIPFVGRVSAYSDKAQNLQSAASKVFNTVLKDRSGAAVTNTELERLKTEFGEGKYNTESQMVAALQRYKRGVQNELKNREAGFRPDVVNRYAEQGGRTSKSGSLSSRPSDPIDPVRVIAPDGSIRLIPKTQVQAAISAGGKLAE